MNQLQPAVNSHENYKQQYQYSKLTKFTMGAKGSKDKKVLEKQNIVIDHPNLKNLIYKKTNDGEIMQASFPIGDKADYLNWDDMQNLDPGARSEDVLTPVSKDFKEAKMCGSGGKANIAYENYPYVLDYEIKNRQDMENRKFEESQLWYLIYTMGNVGSMYHRNGEKIGDVSPKNIFMNEEGSIKMATKYSWPGAKDNYERAFYEKDAQYLAPQEVKQLYIGKSKPETYFESAQSFSAGLTALDATLLDDSKKLYDRNFNFDYDLLNAKRQNLRNQPYYSDLLKDTILNLTQHQPEKRMTLTQLKNWLQPYSRDITSLNQFNPGRTPQKLAETASNYASRRQSYQRMNETFNPRSQQFDNDMPIITLENGQKIEPQVCGPISPQYRSSAEMQPVILNSGYKIDQPQICGEPMINPEYRNSQNNPQFNPGLVTLASLAENGKSNRNSYESNQSLENQNRQFRPPSQYLNSVPIMRRVSSNQPPSNIPMQSGLSINRNSSQNTGQFRNSIPYSQQTNNRQPQFILNGNQNQLSSSQQRNISQQFAKNVVDEQKIQPRKPSIVERIKQVPYQAKKKFQETRQSHVNRQGIHSLSPPRQKINRNVVPISSNGIQSNVQNPIQFPPPQRRQINHPQNAQVFHPMRPTEQRNFASPDQLRYFHSPQPRPVSNFGQQYAGVFRPPSNYGNPRQGGQIYNQVPTNQPRQSRIPSSYAISSGQQISTPSYGRITNENPAKFVVNEPKRYYQQTRRVYQRQEFPISSSSNQQVYSQKIEGQTIKKTSLDMIEQKIRRSRTNFPSEQ